MLGYASTVRAARSRDRTRRPLALDLDMAVLLLRAAGRRDRRRRGVEVDAHDHFVLHADTEIRRLRDAELRHADREAGVEPIAIALRLDVGGAGDLLGLAVQCQHRVKRGLARQLVDADVLQARPRVRGTGLPLAV